MLNPTLRSLRCPAQATKRRHLSKATRLFARKHKLSDNRQDESLVPQSNTEEALKLKLTEDDHVALLKEASILLHAGDLEKAEQKYQQILEIRRETNGDDHPKTLDAIEDLAYCLELQGSYERTIELRQKRYQFLKDALGPAHGDVVSSMNLLASSFDAVGDFKAAEKLYLEAIDLATENLGPDHQDTLSTISNLAASLWSERSLPYRYRLWESFKLVIRVLQRRQKFFGINDLSTLSSAKDIAVLLQTHGQYVSALKIYDFIVSIQESEHGEFHEATISAMECRAQTLNSMGRQAEAQTIAADILTIRNKQFEQSNTADKFKNPLFKSGMKTWYEIYFKNHLSQLSKNGHLDDSKLATEVGVDGNAVATKTIEPAVSGEILTPEIGFTWPVDSVWHFKADKTLSGNTIQDCIQVNFWGFENPPPESQEPFKRKFRLLAGYFGDMPDGMYQAKSDSEEPGIITMIRIKLPYENVLIALCLGEDMTPFDSGMTALPEGSDARRAAAKGETGYDIEFGGTAEQML